MWSINCVSAHNCTFVEDFILFYCVILTDMKELPFLDLNHNRTHLFSETEDSVSDPIEIEEGFLFGNSNQTTLYVCHIAMLGKAFNFSAGFH